MRTALTTLIIDDEMLARERLKRLLNNYRESFNIIGEAENGDEAFILIEQKKPDLIFLDIQMPGKNVFQMLSELKHKPMVIFCTAYDQYALEAFNTYALDYLLKPVEKERLQMTLEKIELGQDQYLRMYQHLNDFNIKTAPPSSIAHKCGNKIIPVKLEHIVYFTASDKYVNFYNVDGEEFLTDQTLISLSQKLPADFLRISKSLIINRNFVKEIHKQFKGKFVFVMNDKQRTRLLSGGNFHADITACFEL
jgi:two-component system, LytTR family, response regulator